MRYPPKPRPGDKVAVLSPSWGGPAHFPEVFELGLRRLKETFDLVPVEFPTTRVMGASAQARADDLHAAFADPEITAILASIGGDDQITVVPLLDDDLLRDNPKPFFGYSDNTNVLNHLYGLGLVGYHGGSVMVHLGRAGRLHPAHEQSLRAALFTADQWTELVAPTEWGDEAISWNEPERFDQEPPMVASQGWEWLNPDVLVEAPTWGGNLEIVSWLLQAGRVESSENYAGQVLVLETSEEMPSATEVYRTLRNMGERGLLQQFPAVLMGRAKTWERGRDRDWEIRRAYTRDQREAVQSAFAQYHPSAMVVFDLDIGHTDPQLILPYGGLVRVDGPGRRIDVRY
jgi:muramoyltetrapeptide carboxypeptidase LdcA involved in peptidoglycan recycling